jgi:hypothetical protein
MNKKDFLINFSLQDKIQQKEISHIKQGIDSKGNDQRKMVIKITHKEIT